MNTLHETVPLPDPAVKPMLHPTDVPEARSSYRRGWWFGRLWSVPVVVAIGAVVWLLTGDLLPALLSPAVTFAIGLLAGRWFTARAWDFIPRRRQARGAAGSWRLLAAVIDGLALLVAATALTLAARTAQGSTGVIAYAVGAGVAVVVLQLAELAVSTAQRRERTRTGPRVVVLAASATATVVASTLAIGPGWNRELVWTALLGAGTLLLAQALWLVARVVGTRRPRAEEVGS